MDFQNGESIFKTDTDIYMNFKTNETVFVRGKAKKENLNLIAVSNLRITGESSNQGSVNIPLERVTSIQIKGKFSLLVYYTNDSGKQKKAIFPPMENAEQIYNTIYSLVFPPSVSPQMR